MKPILCGPSPGNEAETGECFKGSVFAQLANNIITTCTVHVLFLSLSSLPFSLSLYPLSLSFPLFCFWYFCLSSFHSNTISLSLLPFSFSLYIHLLGSCLSLIFSFSFSPSYVLFSSALPEYLSNQSRMTHPPKTSIGTRKLGHLHFIARIQQTVKINKYEKSDSSFSCLSRLFTGNGDW